MVEQDPKTYWNLLYRFTKDKKDFLFMLPYEVDMEDPPSEDETSSISSDGLMTPKNEEGNIRQHQSSRFLRIAKKLNEDKKVSMKKLPSLHDKRGTQVDFKAQMQHEEMLEAITGKLKPFFTH